MIGVGTASFWLPRGQVWLQEFPLVVGQVSSCHARSVPTGAVCKHALSTSKIYLRDATITLRSTYGRRRRATATDRTGCLPESQSASARPGLAPLCSRRECQTDSLVHRSEQGEHPARPRPLPAAGFRGTGRWECSGQSAAYHPRGEGFHAGEAHGGGSHVERHPTERGARRALRHRGYARGCTPAAPLDGLYVEAHPLCAN